MTAVGHQNCYRKSWTCSREQSREAPSHEMAFLINVPTLTALPDVVGSCIRGDREETELVLTCLVGASGIHCASALLQFAQGNLRSHLTGEEISPFALVSHLASSFLTSPMYVLGHVIRA